MALPVEVATTAMTIAVVAVTAEAEDTVGAMTILTVGLATMIVTPVLRVTDGVTITGLAASIAMHPAVVAKTATAAGMTIAVRGTTLPVTAGAATGMCLRGMLTAEVETITILQTIGTPVVRAAR